MESSSCSEFKVFKKEPKTIKTHSKNEIQKQGRWNKEQNMKYLLFLSFNQSKFQCKKKRMYRLYKPLSKFVGTRNSQQCRSHHRKLLQRFKTPKNIINNLNQIFEKIEIQEMRKENHEKLKQLHIPQKKLNNQEKIKSSQEKLTLGKINQNQNNLKKADEISDNERNIVNQNCSKIEQNYSCSIFSPSVEMTMVDYQAYTWFRQMCFANYHYLYNNNYVFSVDSDPHSFLCTQDN